MEGDVISYRLVYAAITRNASPSIPLIDVPNAAVFNRFYYRTRIVIRAVIDNNYFNVRI